ncbi:MAG: polyprenyl synthetase family protein [Lachnospiraceae bacterium]|nr:polyprenyl synthetase family protein [Lachnospiraceae bacterium]MBD5483455.1 polyprenyl synthetase family protein [Lachnospiraceae bacterium]
MNWESEQEEKIRRLEELITSYLPKEEGYQRTASEAMNYSILAGGKRIRPLMMYETYQMYAKDGDAAQLGDRLIAPFLAAIEMIHTYSLVHDDLPAMDNDEYRRGRKTTHVVYGEAMAILAGDGLLTHAFYTAARAFAAVDDTECKIDRAQADMLRGRIGRAVGILAEKAGIDGMLGGQCVDVEAEKRGDTVTMEQLLFIHEKKTAALIQSALMIGAVLAGAPQKDIDRLEQAGRHVGVAFQIRDDILDVEGSLEELGKQTGSDAKNEKATYVTLAGMEQAKRDVERISEAALTELAGLSVTNDFLAELVRRMVYRTN